MLSCVLGPGRWRVTVPQEAGMWAAQRPQPAPVSPGTWQPPEPDAAGSALPWSLQGRGPATPGFSPGTRSSGSPQEGARDHSVSKSLGVVAGHCSQEADSRRVAQKSRTGGMLVSAAASQVSTHVAP